MIKQIHFSQIIIFCVISNLDLDQILIKSVFATFNIQDMKGIDEGLLTGMVLIDLQKAFVTLNQEVLLKNLLNQIPCTKYFDT